MWLAFGPKTPDPGLEGIPQLRWLSSLVRSRRSPLCSWAGSALGRAGGGREEGRPGGAEPLIGSRVLRVTLLSSLHSELLLWPLPPVRVWQVHRPGIVGMSLLAGNWLLRREKGLLTCPQPDADPEEPPGAWNEIGAQAGRGQCQLPL